VFTFSPGLKVMMAKVMVLVMVIIVPEALGQVGRIWQC